MHWRNDVLSRQGKRKLNMENVHIYNSFFLSESRILKQTKTLAESGFFEHIHLVGLWKENLPEVENLDSHRTIHRLRLWTTTRRGILLFEILRFFELFGRIFWKFRDHRFRIINVHSLAVLPIGVILKLVLSKKIIYDAHELETETVGKNGIRKQVAKILEKVMIPFVDETIVVGNEIGSWYRKHYRLSQVSVVRNIPYRSPSGVTNAINLRSIFGIPSSDIIFIYQGLLSPERSVDKLLQLFGKVSPHRHLLLMGDGEQSDEISELSRSVTNIHYHPAVPTCKVLDYAAGADIGVHYIENTCLNHYYCLPNKLFEYIMAGIPVMVRDFPEMGGIVRQFGCGWTMPDTEKEWLEIIEQISIEEIQIKKKAAADASLILGWQQEEKAYLKAFEHLLEQQM
jgi:glycosyltransferase involved in cell wall biosynthesis